MSGQLFRRDVIVVVFFSKIQIIDTRSNCTDLTVRDRLRFQLLEAIELEKNGEFVVSGNFLHD